MKLKEEQKAKEMAKNSETEENADLGKLVWNTRLFILICVFQGETVYPAQSSSAPTPEFKSKSLSLKELAALEKELESAELVAAMAGSCKIEDHSDASQIQDPSKLESTQPPASSTSTSEEECEEGGDKKQQDAGSSASSRPSVAVSAVNLNVYVPEVKRLTDSELYVLCICLCIIRRERDLIMANRFDATEILKVSFILLIEIMLTGTNAFFTHSTLTRCNLVLTWRIFFSTLQPFGLG